MTKIDFMFRADASAEIGWGHVTRCMALAEILTRDYGLQVGFITHALPDTLRARADEINTQVLDLKSCAATTQEKADALESLALMLDHQCKMLLADHYSLSHVWRETVRPHVEYLALMDDSQLLPNSTAFDLVINGSLGASDLMASDVQQGEAAHCLLGPDFSLLNPMCIQTRNRRERAFRIGGPKRLLVNFGATDVKNVLPAALAAILSKMGAQVRIDSFVNGSEGKAAVLSQLSNEHRRFVTLHDAGNPKDFIEALGSVDIYIGAGGVTALEACAVGIPQILWAVAANQMTQVRLLEAHGAAIAIEDENVSTAANKIGTHVADLIRAPEKRREMGLSGAALYDGRGAERVAAYMAASFGFDAVTPYKLTI